MKHQKQLLTVLLMSAASMLQAQRSETLLEKNWKFSKGDFPEAAQTDYNDTKWESVVIPHDWAIFGPVSYTHLPPYAGTLLPVLPRMCAGVLSLR